MNHCCNILVVLRWFEGYGVEGRDDFTFWAIGVSTRDDWSEPVCLDRNGNDWTLPAGELAQFFRVQLSE